MMTVILELTIGDCVRLQDDFKKYGGGPMFPKDFDPMNTTNAYVDPEEKKQYRTTVPDNFFVLATQWLPHVIQSK